MNKCGDKRVVAIVTDSELNLSEAAYPGVLAALGYPIEHFKQLDHLKQSKLIDQKYAAIIVDHDHQSREKQALYEKIGMLRELSENRSLFILIGAYSLQTVKTAVDSGFHEFFAKPVNSGDLVVLLKSKLM